MSYDTITARGQTIRTSEIGTDEWSGKVLDVRNGNGITVLVDDSTDISNVGVKGLYQGDGFIFSVTNRGDPITFTNIYMADGANKSGSTHAHGPGGFFYHKDGDCKMRFEHCRVEGYPNNGWYCSNTASGGSVTWDHCLGKNNGVSTFRCASSRDRVVNSTAYNDNTDYGTSDGRWGNFSETQGRPVWVWPPGGAQIEDCHFDAGSYGSGKTIYGHEGANYNAERNTVGREHPPGLPESAEDAASGSSEGGYGEGGYGEGGYGGDGDPHYISGPDADEWATRFTVNMVGSEGSFRLLADADILQGYWWPSEPDKEYIEDVDVSRSGDGHWLVEGSIENDTVCLVTQGDVVAIETDAPEFQLWRNGNELTADDFPAVGEYFDDHQTCEERVEELETEKQQLEDQLAEYETSIDELDEALETAEEKAPHYGSAFEYLRGLLP